MKTRLLTPMCVLAAIVLIAAPKPSGAQIRTCPSVGAKAQQMRAYVADYITSSDPDVASFRQTWGITAGDTSNLAIVTNDTLCDAVTSAMDSSATTRRSTSVIVIRFQTFFMAADPENDGLLPMYLLDSSYRPKTAIVLPN